MFVSLVLMGFGTLSMTAKFKSGHFNQILMKGGTAVTFILGNLLVDICTYLVVILIMWAIITLGGIEIPGFGAIAVLWAFAEPLFYISFTYFFWVSDKDTEQILGVQTMGTLVHLIIVGIVINGWADPIHHVRASYMAKIVSFFPLSNFILSIAQILQRDAAYFNVGTKQEDFVPGDHSWFSTWGCREQMEWQVGWVIIYIVILVLSLGGRCTQKVKFEELEAEKPSAEDQLVKAEQERVQGGASDVLVVNSLVKRYRKAIKEKL